MDFTIYVSNYICVLKQNAIWRHQYKLSDDIRLSKFNKVEHHIHLERRENIYEPNKISFVLEIYLRT